MSHPLWVFPRPLGAATTEGPCGTCPSLPTFSNGSQKGASYPCSTPQSEAESVAVPIATQTYRHSHPPAAHDLRLASQRAAFSMLRRHAVRAIVRASVLMAADMAVCGGARLLFRPIRTAVPGLDLLVPQGLLGGIQPFVAFALGLMVAGAYREGDRWRAWGRVFEGVALGAGLVLWSNLFTEDPGRTLLQWAIITLPLATLISASRTVISHGVRRKRQGSGRRERVLLIVPEDDHEFISQSLLFSDSGPFEISARLVLEDPGAYEGFTERMLGAMNGYHAETVVVGGYVSNEVWGRIVELADAAGCRLLSMAGHGGSLVTSLRQTSYRGIPVTEVTTPQLRFHQLLVKRVFDVLVACGLLVVLSPLLLILAAAIRATSRGPVLFRQERVGQGGRHFRIYKFRSMREDAEELLPELESASIYEDPRLFKVHFDPRVTRLGAFLRSSSLDELPQLINVLKGEMSLVGPRPPMPREVVLYEAHHYARFDVKPGMTGPWQVAGRNEIKDFEEVVLLERSYIRRWNLGKDLRILLETLPVVLFRRGAY